MLHKVQQNSSISLALGAALAIAIVAVSAFFFLNNAQTTSHTSTIAATNNPLPQSLNTTPINQVAVKPNLAKPLSENSTNTKTNSPISLSENNLGSASEAKTTITNQPHTERGQTYKSELAKKHLAKMQELTKLAAEQKWDEFLTLADDVFSMPEHYKTSTLTAAIRDKAPKRVFETLLANGAKFAAHHTFRAVRMGDIHFLQTLITLGLDIHSTDKNGENAINAMLKTQSSRKMFNFLLAHNVDIKMDKNGVSLLTKSLTIAKNNKEAVYYAYKFVQHGVPISQDDIALVQQIKQHNVQSYELIQRNIPELIGS